MQLNCTDSSILTLIYKITPTGASVVFYDQKFTQDTIYSFFVFVLRNLKTDCPCKIFAIIMLQSGCTINFPRETPDCEKIGFGICKILCSSM